MLGFIKKKYSMLGQRNELSPCNKCTYQLWPLRDKVSWGKAILSSLSTKYVCQQLLFNRANSRWHEPYVIYILSQQQ